MASTLNGTIKRLVGDKGFGFILADDGQVDFFHQSAFAQGSFSSLREGRGGDVYEGSGAQGTPCRGRQARLARRAAPEVRARPVRRSRRRLDLRVGLPAAAPTHSSSLKYHSRSDYPRQSTSTRPSAVRFISVAHASMTSASGTVRRRCGSSDGGSRSAPRRFQIAARRSIGQFAELAPSRLTPRRMNGKTVASKRRAAALPTAATLPHSATWRIRPASSGPPTLSMTPPNRAASSGRVPSAERVGRRHLVGAELAQVGLVLGAPRHGNHRVAAPPASTRPPTPRRPSRRSRRSAPARAPDRSLPCGGARARR